MPTGTEIYATRDIDRLRRMAADHGAAIGVYATAILDTPLPWTKMRQVYRLLGLVKKWGADARRPSLPAGARRRSRRRQPRLADARARPREDAEPDAAPDPVVIQGRFARDPSEFASGTKETGR